MERCAELLNSVFNRILSVNDVAINRLPQIKCNVVLDEFPTLIEKAIQHLSSGKAPGADAIPAETYKAGRLPIAEKLTELFQCKMRNEAIPQEFNDASIIILRQPQRHLSLIAGKILAKLLLNRLNVHLDQAELLSES